MTPMQATSLALEPRGRPACTARQPVTATQQKVSRQGGRQAEGYPILAERSGMLEKASSFTILNALVLIIIAQTAQCNMQNLYCLLCLCLCLYAHCVCTLETGDAIQIDQRRNITTKAALENNNWLV